MDTRCFGTGNLLTQHYHDFEWGIAVHCDQHLFEMLCLEGAQSGLNWDLILRKREGYRRLFHQFVPERVAQMSDRELEEVLGNQAVIRNRRKIWSVRKNALVFLDIAKEYGSFDAYLWGFVGGTPLLNRWERWEQVPCESPQSVCLSKDLKARGMQFVGPKIMYSLMQAVGLVNDHLLSCPFRRGVS